MSTYSPRKVQTSNGLDELGIRLGLFRLPDEDLAAYQQRLYLEARDHGGSSEKDFIRALGRQVGLFDIPVFKIDLQLEDGIPKAPDAFVEITSTRLKAWSDFSNGEIDIELSLIDRDDAYFLREVYTAFAASDYFSIEVLFEDYLFLRSCNLQFGNTELVASKILQPNSVNLLGKMNIKTIWFQSPEAFQSEKSTKVELLQEGDYYIDRYNGVVFTYSLASGLASYCYRDFPYTVKYQPVRAFPLNDQDTKYYRYDTIISDSTGNPDWKLLNSDGAKLANQILAAHPLQWGE